MEQLSSGVVGDAPLKVDKQASFDKTLPSFDMDHLDNLNQQVDQLSQTIKDKDEEISKTEKHNQELE